MPDVLCAVCVVWGVPRGVTCVRHVIGVVSQLCVSWWCLQDVLLSFGHTLEVSCFSAHNAELYSRVLCARAQEHA